MLDFNGTCNSCNSFWLLWPSGGTSNFTATVTGQEYYTYYTYTNHVSSSSSTVNLGATFSVSGAGWSVGSTGFSTSNSANTHAESIRSSIASALPSGWSVVEVIMLLLLLLLQLQAMLMICL